MADERNMLNQAAWELARDTEAFFRINAGERDLDRETIKPDEDDVWSAERNIRNVIEHLALPLNHRSSAA